MKASRRPNGSKESWQYFPNEGSSNSDKQDELNSNKQNELKRCNAEATQHSSALGDEIQTSLLYHSTIKPDDDIEKALKILREQPSRTAQITNKQFSPILLLRR